MDERREANPPLRKTTSILAASLTLAASGSALATDWILAPSTYTHDPQTGERISQFAPVPPVYLRPGRPDYVQSGYRHRQSVIRDPLGSADRLHITEQWGRPVRPYGEWRFPYRPYSVPYPLWGPPNVNYQLSNPYGWGGGPWGGSGPRPGPVPPPIGGGTTPPGGAPFGPT
jgi:hypothetical protein